MVDILRFVLIFGLVFTTACGQDSVKKQPSMDTDLRGDAGYEKSDTEYERSESSIVKEWKLFVESHNFCDSVDQCAIVYPTCPLGCGSPIAKEHEHDGKNLADSLVEAFGTGNDGTARVCSYGCQEIGPVICLEGRCEFSE